MEIKNLSIETKDGRKLISNVSFSLNNNDKVAIIGEEGNGKTTLMKAIIKPEELSKDFNITGQVSPKNLKIGYLEQFFNKEWENQTPIDYILKETCSSEPNYDIYNDYFAFTKILTDLGLSEDFINSDQKISTLSGGEKVKLQILKILLSKPDILFLDEPTNDLDISTLNWLENFINSCDKPVLFVSHDETLLEKTANGILHLEQIKKKSEPRATFEKTGYKDYVSNRIARLDKQDQLATFEHAQRKEQEKTLREIKNKIQQQNPGRTNSMRAIISREGRWERTQLTEHTDVEDAIKICFNEKAKLPSKKIVLDLNLPELRVGERLLSKNITLKIVGPEKLVIIGNNGCGKTTLLKTILNYYSNTKLEGINVGYMPQNYDDLLESNISPENYLLKNSDNPDKERRTLIRTALGRLNFTEKEATSPISQLSGGQKAKLFLTNLVLKDYNVLILDEPTRNLSPLSNPVIRNILKNYEGAIISVSHDRKYIKEVCDRIEYLTTDGLKHMDFP